MPWLEANYGEVYKLIFKHNRKHERTDTKNDRCVCASLLRFGKKWSTQRPQFKFAAARQTGKILQGCCVTNRCPFFHVTSKGSETIEQEDKGLSVCLSV